MLKKKEVDEKIAQGIEKLYQELQEGKTENLEKVFQLAGKTRYSANNLALIFSQCPWASTLYTYPAWAKKGYKVVKKGAIYIYQPRPYKQEITDKNGNETGETETKMWYKLIPMFDISQVIKVDENAPDINPNVFAVSSGTSLLQMEGEYQEEYDRIRGIIVNDGIRVKETKVILGRPSCEGASFGGLILTKEQSSGNMLVALIHEWAHEKLHSGSENKAFSTQHKECQAEAVAYIVCSAIGIHSPFSKDYILGWGNTVEDFKKNLDYIVKTSKYMLGKIQVQIDEEKNNEEVEEIA
ncbi:MAG: hypothetical protein AB7G87_03750 [Clostridia bacterium]